MENVNIVKKGDSLEYESTQLSKQEFYDYLESEELRLGKKADVFGYFENNKIGYAVFNKVE